MFQIKMSYMLPDGHTIDKVLEYQDRHYTDEVFDRWYRAYDLCVKESKILEFCMVMTEIKEIYTVVSSKEGIKCTY